MLKSEIFKIVSRNANAVATNRGFYFQYLCLLKKWVAHYVNESEAEIFTEVDEDIKEVGNCIVFTQVKSYSSPFNLQSKEIRKTLYNFFILFLKEQENQLKVTFVFETNSNVAIKDTLLASWVADQTNLDIELKRKCCNRVQIILNDEIKANKRIHLNHKNLSDEKKREITESFRAVQDELSEKNLLKFVGSVGWKFISKAPDIAIRELLKDLNLLLSNSKFNGQPTSLLLDVLLSEIYRCSQNSDEKRRLLTASRIKFLLQKTENDLQSFVDKKVIYFLGSRFDSIEQDLFELQQKQKLQELEIQSINSFIKNQVKSAVPPKYLTSIPFIDSSRVFGRKDDITQVRKLLSQNKSIAIHGIPGLGKSTIAKLLVCTCGHEFNHIIWLEAGESLVSNLIFNEELAINLELDFKTNENHKQNFVSVVKKISLLPGDNLIIVDGFKESFNIIEPLLQLSNCSCVITTRELLKNITKYRLQQIDYTSARELFLSLCKTTTDDSVLAEFFMVIDYNTLVIELVAKTINSSVDLDLVKFMALFKDQRLDDLELDISIEKDDQNDQIKLFSFLQSTFRFANLSSEEEYIMQFLSLLPSGSTRLSDLVAICGSADEKINKVKFANICNSLHSKGWIERVDDYINMNKIVQEIIIYNGRKQINPFVGNIFFIVWLTRRFSEGFISNPTNSIRFLKYGESILHSIKEPFRTSLYQPLLTLENEVLNIYNWFPKDDDILARWKNLFDSANNKLDDDQLLAVICNNYGLALSERGYLAQSTNLLKKSIELFRRNEKDISNLFTALANLSMVYIIEDNYQDFSRVTLEMNKIATINPIFDGRFGAMQCNILGIANQKIGNLKEAIKFFLLAVKLHSDLTKDKRNDINLVLYLNNLAFNEFLGGDKSVAISHQIKALNVLDNLQIPNFKLESYTLKILASMYEDVGDAVNYSEINTRVAGLKKQL